jgi:LacI family transcriptional regulator
MSRSTFYGERERVDAFVDQLAREGSQLRTAVVSDTDGLDSTLAARTREALAHDPAVCAAYSVGGGNRAIAAEFARAGRECRVFVAHDLDLDNVELLGGGTLSAVLHHDLRADMRRALRQVLRAHGVLPGAPTSVAANVEVVTPHNLPARLLPG